MTTPDAPSYWLAHTPYKPGRVLRRDWRADVVIVGAGYTGLWTAHALLDNDPSLEIIVLEADTVGFAASGRNGGFLDPSLTHGLLNGIKHFPREIERLEELAEDNYASMQKFFTDHDVDCDFEPVGMLEVATREHELADLAEVAETYRRYGQEAELLDAEQAQALLHSPRILGAVRRPDAGGVLDPAKLVRELARVARERGVVIHERSGVTAIDETDSPTHAMLVRTARGTVSARRVVLATNAQTARILPSAGRRYV